MTDTVRFLAYHRPALIDGEYRIKIEQKTVAAGSADTFSIEKTFSIGGERFSLAPGEITNVFPPPESIGDHTHVLPHVVLRRSTLPWERSADASVHGEKPPWLALLVLGEESFTESTTTLDRIRLGGGAFPDIVPPTERGAVTVVDIARRVLEQILPTQKELALLTHVREVVEPAATNPSPETVRPSPTELAVVVANRLPSPRGFSTAHLVSLESRYKNGLFDHGTTKPDDTIRLVSLHSWRFRCEEPQHTFTELLKQAHCGTLRLSPSSDSDVEPFYARGCVPLRHRVREGSKTVSWYQGPLSPALSLPVERTVTRCADQLLRYDESTGMFDVSYAAAWELGRLLALRSKRFSLGLYRWKRGHPEQQAPARAPSYLPLVDLRPSATQAPAGAAAELQAWFRDLNQLKGVPFCYLVADERLLPADSLRFFSLDAQWIEHLLDGAFSIGRVDQQRDEEHRSTGVFKTPHPHVTGLIVRSPVISGWPNLELQGYDKVTHSQADQPLEKLRCEQLSPDVLIVLFAGAVARVEFHPRLETLHFGLDRTQAGYEKRVRSAKGRVATVPWRTSSGAPRVERVVDIAALHERMQGVVGKPVSPADFALQMVEGVERVRIEIVAPPAP